MRKPSRRTVVLSLIALAFAGLVGLALLWLLADIPRPDLGDLALRRRVVPHEENGFSVLSAAPGIVNDPDFLPGTAFTEEWDPARARALIEKNAALLAAWEESLERPDFQVPRFESFEDDRVVRCITAWSGLERLSRDRVGLLLADGSPGDALREALRQVRHGHRMECAQGLLITYLVGIAIKAKGLDTLREVLRRGAFSADDLRDALAELTGRESRPTALEDTLRADFAVVDESAESVGDELPGALPSSLFLLPNETRRLFAEAYRTLIANLPLKPADRKPFPDAGLWTLFEVPPPQRNLSGKLTYAMSLFSLETVASRYDQIRLDVVRTRALLALRLWHLEHGALPSTLDALVPDYLPAVPEDPYDGAPLRYSRERRIIWSVGEDLSDDGGEASDDPTLVIEFPELTP